MKIKIVLLGLLFIVASVTCAENTSDLLEYYLRKAKGHTTESNTYVFDYVVAVLKKSKFLSAGVLIDNFWVMTGADGLYAVKDTFRLLRVRVGSTNYKKDGILRPVQHYSMHPWFDGTSPAYDLALIRLAASVELTNYINPIRMQIRKKEVVATHFTVTAWKPKVDLQKKYSLLRAYDFNTHHGQKSLQVLQMHPTESGKCRKFVASLGVNTTDGLMCLEPGLDAHPCEREGGAPVVLNRVLWGIISSWTPENCTNHPGPLVVNLLSNRDVSEWVQSTLNDEIWVKDDGETIYNQMHDDYGSDED